MRWRLLFTVVAPRGALMALALTGARPAPAAEPDYSGYAMLFSQRYAVAREYYSSGLRTNPRVLTTGFDYARLRERQDPAGADGTLAMIHRQLLAVAPSQMTAAERTAWGINLYNFLVIRQVVRHLGPAERPLQSVMDVKDFFEAPVVTVEDVSYSLNGFERHFLFADFDRKSDAPPASLDPRVHFAIVCGARGCPPLLGRPYRAVTLERDLEANTRAALETRQHARMDPRTGRFTVSSIFDWYEKDFGGRAGVIEFLKRYGPTPLRLSFGSIGVETVTGFIPWDWRLNQVAPQGDDEPR